MDNELNEVAKRLIEYFGDRDTMEVEYAGDTCYVDVPDDLRALLAELRDVLEVLDEEDK